MAEVTLSHYLVVPGPQDQNHITSQANIPGQLCRKILCVQCCAPDEHLFQLFKHHSQDDE